MGSSMSDSVNGSLGKVVPGNLLAAETGKAGLSSSHTLSSLTREGRLAVGLSEDEKFICYKIAGSLPKSFRFSLWTETESPSLCSINGTLAFSSKGPLDEQLRSCRNRFLYQIARVSWFACEEYFPDLDAIKQKIAGAIKGAHHMCIICMKDLGTGNLLYRSTTCSSMCERQFRSAALEVQAPELEACKLPVVDERDLLIRWFGALATLFCRNSLTSNSWTREEVYHVNHVIKAVHHEVTQHRSPAERRAALIRKLESLKRDTITAKLPTWCARELRGCLIQSFALDVGHDASFHLFNAAPELERAFAKEWLRAKKLSMVVFHGTTIDRLYPIMCEGVRFDAHLRRVGNRHGDGVYVTNDSELAMQYARRSYRPDWNTTLKVPFRVHVLLICELIEPERFWRADKYNESGRRYDIYVVDEPNMVVLRALVAAPPDAELPKLSSADLEAVIWRNSSN